MDYVEDKANLEKQFFDEIHHILGIHRSTEMNLAWLGDTVTLEGSFTSAELNQIAETLDKYKASYIALRNELE